MFIKRKERKMTNLRNPHEIKKIKLFSLVQKIEFFKEPYVSITCKNKKSPYFGESMELSSGKLPFKYDQKKEICYQFIRNGFRYWNIVDRAAKLDFLLSFWQKKKSYSFALDFVT